MSQNSNNNNIGEIFILAVPDDRKGEIEQNEDYNFRVSPSLMQENLYRVQCVGQPRIQHRSVGYRCGFVRGLSFRTVHQTEQSYNDLMQWINNRRLAVFVQDELGHIQMMYHPCSRLSVAISGTDEVHHEICVESSPITAYHTPISLLVRQDGSPLTVQEFEAMVK